MTQAGMRVRSAARSDRRLIDGILFQVLLAANLTAQPFTVVVGRPHRLTLASWRCMIALAAMPGACGEDVVGLTGLDKMSVSRGLRGLLKASRAQRVEDPEGAHRWLWQLTPKGWALYDAILPMAQRRERDAVSGLGAAATKALKTGLQSVVTRLTDKPNLAAIRHRQR